MRIQRECRRISASLWDHAKGRLSVAETEAIDRHIASCRACQAEAGKYAATVGMLRTVRFSEVPESRTTWRDLRDRIPAEKSVTPMFSWRRMQFAAPALACAALAGLFWFNSGQPHVSTLTVPGAPSTSQQVANSNVDPEDSNFGFLNSTPAAIEAHETVGSPSSVHGATERNRVLALRIPPRLETRREVAAAAHPNHPTLARTDDDSSMDGTNPPAKTERDFVITPVATGSQDTDHDYVIGGIADTGQRVSTVVYEEGSEEGRGW